MQDNVFAAAWLLSILYLRCIWIDYHLTSPEEPFNSLFEMPLSDGSEVAFVPLTSAFNSLFEMQMEGAPKILRFKIYSFNSLFEMPGLSRRGAAGRRPGTLSILYLRCEEGAGETGARDTVRRFQFSI